MIVVVLLATACAAWIVILVVSHWLKSTHLPVTTEWITELSFETSRCMMGSLGDEDFRFLRSQPGYTLQMETRLRAMRCQMFHNYLHHLETDFKRICIALQLMMVQAQFDRPDLASTLIRSQVAFMWGVIRVKVQLSLYRLGIGAIDLTGLVRRSNAMRIELGSLVLSRAVEASS